MKRFADMKTVIMPSADEILDRLVKADSKLHYCQKLYPLLVKNADAGKKVNGAGVVMAIHLALHEYTENLPDQMRRLVMMDVEMFIEAMITDPQVVAEAKEVWKEMES